MIRDTPLLLRLAALYLLLYAAALSLAPVARGTTWNAAWTWQPWAVLLLWGAASGVAFHQQRRLLPHSDPYLLPIAVLLSGWGALTITRLLPVFGLRQALWLASGLSLLALSLRLPSNLDFLRRYKYLWLLGGLLLTALTLGLGSNPLGYGPRLWLGCCGLYLQPSEPLKLLLILFLAAYFADRIPLLRLNPKTPGEAPLAPLLLPTLMLVGVALGLLLVQRDLGTASLFLFLYTTLLYLATGKRRVLLVALVMLPLGGLAGYALFGVVRVRVDAWLNPWLDPGGNSYQIVQSLLAVASGGLLGRGPGMGSPALVPVAHSDFIFAAIAEETGLQGALALIALLALLSLRAIHIALRAAEPYYRYLAAGLGAYFGGQSILIIGGTLRLLPLTGVTLPFVSYGGSSLWTNFLALALLLHVSARNAEARPFRQAENPAPYAQLAALLLGGFLGTALLSGWWGVVRAPAFLARPDNTRRSIAARYSPRGDIRARDSSPLALTVGRPGEYTRLYPLPPAAPVIGYTHPVFGESGLEAGMDAVLRGLEGYPAATVWKYHLLYGTPPPGLDIRTSLDPALQSLADDLLGDTPGALVLLNAASGEIYAMASHPGFDPNHLEETWEDLLEDSRAPLLNRAVQGRYQAGPAAGALLLGDYLSRKDSLPPLPARPEYAGLECARPPAAETWSAWLRAGCPAPLAALGAGIPWGEGIPGGLGKPPKARLPYPLGEAELPSGSKEDYLGLSAAWRVNPLEMALAAAALSNGGTRPAPRLVTARQTPEGAWMTLPALGEAMQVFSLQGAREAASLLTVEGAPRWMTVALAPASERETYTWVLAGTLPGGEGAPLALALVLEAPRTEQAQQAAETLLAAALGR